jgi:hypothetical protein
MTLATAAIMVGSTGISATGGTSDDLESVSDSIGYRHSYFGSSDFLSRNNIVFTSTEPKVSASSPGGFTQERREVTIKYPKTLLNGAKTTNVVRLYLSADPETTEAEKTEMIFNAAQVLGDTDFLNYWLSGSVA